MRKVIFFLIFTVILASLSTFIYTQVKSYKLTKAYIYRDEMLIIDDTDVYCSYFIRARMNKDLYIIGAERQYTDKKQYDDGHRMYMNGGTNDGIQDGDMFLVIHESIPIKHKITNKKLGVLYGKMARAKVVCAYEDKSTIVLEKTCNPVNIGDLLIPFKEEEKLLMKKLDWQRCRLPDSPIEGTVCYMNLFKDTEKHQAANLQWVTVDIGKAEVSRGDWLIIWREMGKGLPPMIFGTAVVLNPEGTNSTIKIIESIYPVLNGDRVVLLKEAKDILAAAAMVEQRKKEKIPILERLEKEKEAGKAVQELNVVFNLNENKLSDAHKTEIGQLEAFIKEKPEVEIILRGYCCSIGGVEYNLKLSKQRVDAVKKYLVDTFNLAEDVFETYHYGEKDPPHDNTTEEQRRKNRLVNIQVIEK